MSQVGSNAAGEVFANFKLDPQQAEEALQRIGEKAVDTGNKVEESLGKGGEAGAKQMATTALGAASAVGAIIAATDRVLKAVTEWNASAGKLADTYRDLDKILAPITGQIAGLSTDYDKLAQQATEAGNEQIRKLEEQAAAWDLVTLARKLYADVAEVQLEEEAQIEQIENRRKELLESIAKAKQQAFLDNAEALDRKRANEEQLRTANELAKLEKETQDARRAGLTEQERQVEALRDRIEEIKSLASASSNAATKAQFEAYAEAFANRLQIAMQPVMDDAAEKFVKSVQDKFAGAFDSGVLTDGFGVIGDKLDAIGTQLQNRGML